MTDLYRRLAAAERKLASRDAGADARLIRRLEQGRFRSVDLDELYELVQGPLRAAVLRVTTKCRGQITGPPLDPIPALACIVAYPGNWSAHPVVSVTADEILEDCKRVLAASPFQVQPEFERRYGAQRGLLQRLLRESPIAELREELLQLRGGVEDWPLPQLSRAEGARLLRLVTPLALWGYPLLVWRNHEGNPVSSGYLEHRGNKIFHIRGQHRTKVDIH